MEGIDLHTLAILTHNHTPFSPGVRPSTNTTMQEEEEEEGCVLEEELQAGH